MFEKYRVPSPNVRSESECEIVLSDHAYKPSWHLVKILKPIGEDGEACGRGSSRAVGASSGAVGAVGRASSGHPHFEHANRAYDPGRLELLRLFGRRRLGCCH